MPPISVTFGSLAYQASSGSGSLVASGGLQLAIRETNINTTPIEGDYCIVGTKKSITITFPDPTSDSRLLLSKGEYIILPME